MDKRAPPLPLGTLTNWGKIQMIGSLKGERYYWMDDGEVVSMIDAATVEESHTQCPTCSAVQTPRDDGRCVRCGGEMRGEEMIEMIEYQAKIKQTVNYAAKIGYNRRYGFFVLLPEGIRVPADWREVEREKHGIRYKTAELDMIETTAEPAKRGKQ